MHQLYPHKECPPKKRAGRIIARDSASMLGQRDNREKNFPIGRARAEAIKRDLLTRLKRKEPGFHRE